MIQELLRSSHKPLVITDSCAVLPSQDHELEPQASPCSRENPTGEECTFSTAPTNMTHNIGRLFSATKKLIDNVIRSLPHGRKTE